mmetsp:Transcript_15648/g.29685  ORF Transcript_15648/g.29685 Transcript_15648/m.29685 type:complete len:319 (-) Transcript_15648:342-1298(-)
MQGTRCMRAAAARAAGASAGSLLAQELLLLLGGLEAAVSKLGRRVDELESDLLGGSTRGLRNKGLTQRNDALASSRDASLDHDIVFVHFTVVRKAAHRSDGLGGEIRFRASVRVDLRLLPLLGVLASGLANTVDLLVDFGTVMVAVLTGTGHRILDASRVPRADTRHLTQTPVSLTGETRHAPAGDDAFVTLTLGDSNAVDHFILLEHAVDRNFVLEELFAVGDLVGNGSTVDLDLHQVSLLLAELALFDLGVREHTNHLARLRHALQAGSHDLLVREVVLTELGGAERLVLEERVLLGVGEALFLRPVPVFVEAALY